MTPDTLEQLRQMRQARTLAVLATRLPDGLQLLLREQSDQMIPDAPEDVLRVLPVDRLATAAAAAAATSRSQMVSIDDVSWFLHVHAPPPRLLVVGAVHIAQALAPLAQLVGLAVTVIDPRHSFATAERFPGIDLVTLWPDEGLQALGMDRDSAVVTLTHDPKLDDPALDTALAGPAFYIGALGSKKTQAARRDRLRQAGFDDAALRRIRGPVGLPIGAIGASEIALSIVSEIIAVRRGAALAERVG